ncbi:M48 family metalloprotease [Magnetovibrio blakemorei]|uniref:Peptidase M48 domain-containing protein n=1 Tax=Magnetovibrio blakemorei TaxID=28181 RepID=A0A1E5Q3V3_9PROT|nr:hypothetical protein [Magnetovibrio blakemorei]OEJ64388.1 hypothetical protein BEN30_16380 [Magnetovibrio blakemorei]
MKFLRRFVKAACVCVLLTSLTQTSGVAEDGVFVCTLANGADVPIVLDNALLNIAIAIRDAQGRPFIIANPQVMAAFKPATRWFWLAHECAHHQLGHTLGHYGPDREQQADCLAAKQLVKNNQMGGSDLQAIEDDISKVESSSSAHLPGPARAAEITDCVRSQVNEGQND